MRQPLKIFIKRVLRIAVFSFGGLLVTLGLFAIVASLVQIPDDSSVFIPVVAVVIVIAGVGICFLAPKVVQPLADSRRMSKEEKIIKNIEKYIKQRKLRITLFIFLLGMMLSGLIWTVWQEEKLDAMMTPEHISSMASFEDPNHEFPILFSRFYTLAGCKAKLMFQKYYLAAWAGLLIALLIIEFAGLNKHELTLLMWERIQQLENEAKDSKAYPQKDGQQITGTDGV